MFEFTYPQWVADLIDGFFRQLAMIAGWILPIFDEITRFLDRF